MREIAKNAHLSIHFSHEMRKIAKNAHFTMKNFWYIKRITLSLPKSYDISKVLATTMRIEASPVDISQYSDEEILKAIGSRLREIRLSRDMTQQALAQASGLSVFTITQTENGHNVSILNIVKALRAMGRLEQLAVVGTDAPELHTDRKHASFHHHAESAEN